MIIDTTSPCDMRRNRGKGESQHVLVELEAQAAEHAFPHRPPVDVVHELETAVQQHDQEEDHAERHQERDLLELPPEHVAGKSVPSIASLMMILGSSSDRYRKGRRRASTPEEDLGPDAVTNDELPDGGFHGAYRAHAAPRAMRDRLSQNRSGGPRAKSPARRDEASRALRPRSLRPTHPERPSSRS